ncbi:hypothetical protein [Caloramator sp. ALD01]|uniref:hypothetical protein n=1 Tax=Caloramator sp. ALD01 TaxID=1031288 RepID=UPI0004152AF6|nr:hypothetical protein [Caloramator sp. ALD01]
MIIYVRGKTLEQAEKFAEIMNKGQYVDMDYLKNEVGVADQTLVTWLQKIKDEGFLKVKYEIKEKTIKKGKTIIRTSVKIAKYKAFEKVEVKLRKEDTTYIQKARETARLKKLSEKRQHKTLINILRNTQEISKKELIDYGAIYNFQGSCLQLIKLAQKMGVKVC